MIDIDNKSVTAAYRRRTIRQEELREQLNALAYLRVLERLARKAHHLSPEQVPAYRLKADTYCKLLNKALPDLSAVAYSASAEKPADECTTAELDRRIASLRARRIELDREARAASGQPEPSNIYPLSRNYPNP